GTIDLRTGLPGMADTDDCLSIDLVVAEEQGGTRQRLPRGLQGGRPLSPHRLPQADVPQPRPGTHCRCVQWYCRLSGDTHIHRPCPDIAFLLHLRTSHLLRLPGVLDQPGEEPGRGPCPPGSWTPQ